VSPGEILPLEWGVDSPWGSLDFAESLVAYSGNMGSPEIGTQSYDPPFDDDGTHQSNNIRINDAAGDGVAPPIMLSARGPTASQADATPLFPSICIGQSGVITDNQRNTPSKLSTQPLRQLAVTGQLCGGGLSMSASSLVQYFLP